MNARLLGRYDTIRYATTVVIGSAACMPMKGGALSNELNPALSRRQLTEGLALPPVVPDSGPPSHCLCVCVWLYEAHVQSASQPVTENHHNELSFLHRPRKYGTKCVPYRFTGGQVFQLPDTLGHRLVSSEEERITRESLHVCLTDAAAHARSPH